MRHPLISLEQSILTIAFLEEPVEWNAVDKKPVSVICVLCSPSTKAHLHLQSRLAFFLQDEKCRQALIAEPKRTDVIQMFNEKEIKLSSV